MVTRSPADNLNHDVLESIFDYVLDSKDLAAVALVSRTFLSGAIPKLYSTLTFRLQQAKSYPNMLSPFRVVLMHKEIAPHVRHVDIRTIPLLKAPSTQLHPIFLRECREALDICRNIVSFKCTVNGALPPFLLSLSHMRRLQSIRVYASLSTEQAEKLIQVTNLRTLALDYGSWNSLDLLPVWTLSNQNTLTNLILYMCSELNDAVLEQVLRQLPGLLGLHIVGCPKVDHNSVVQLVCHVPLLESLSMSITESSKPLLCPPPVLPHLRHLALLSRTCMTASSSMTSTVLSSILAHVRPTRSIISFTLRLPDRKPAISHSFIEQLLLYHAHTLERISFVDTSIPMESLVAICSNCVRLERLEIPFPARDLISVSHALARSYTLRTVVDTTQQATDRRSSLTMDNIRYMMDKCLSLTTVVTDKRIWRGQHKSNNLVITLERRRASSSSSYWFMPRGDTH